jgi:nitrate reductase NapE
VPRFDRNQGLPCRAAHDLNLPPPSTMSEPSPQKAELKAFLFLTVVMAPALAGIIIATYGLAVWIYQMFMGPPTS